MHSSRAIIQRPVAPGQVSWAAAHWDGRRNRRCPQALGGLGKPPPPVLHPKIDPALLYRIQATPSLVAVPAHAHQRMAVITQARRSDVLADREDADLISYARSRMNQSAGYNAAGAPGTSKVEVDPNADLVTKLKAAWRIFFPEQPRSMSPKEEGKKRLRMILVADRCGRGGTVAGGALVLQRGGPD